MKSKRNLRQVFVDIFDILFIMILCFATLLTTMLMRGKVIVGSGTSQGMDYSISGPMVLITVLVLIVYLIFVLARSDKELHSMVNNQAVEGSDYAFLAYSFWVFDLLSKSLVFSNRAVFRRYRSLDFISA